MCSMVLYVMCNGVCLRQGIEAACRGWRRIRVRASFHRLSGSGGSEPSNHGAGGKAAEENRYPKPSSICLNELAESFQA